VSHDELPRTAFVDPRGGNRQDVEQLAREVRALVLGSLASAADRPPLPSEPLDLGRRAFHTSPARRR
jgi:hypothetical protein